MANDVQIPYRVAILTISDRSSAGLRPDGSGPEVWRIINDALPATLVTSQVVPDDVPAIVDALRQWSDDETIDLILTTGGTGLAPRDVTPEATRQVIERDVPGIPEAMRAASLTVTPFAMLSRMAAGIRGRTLIINLPGSPKAVRENLAVVVPVLGHALDKLRGDPTDCVVP